MGSTGGALWTEVVVEDYESRLLQQGLGTDHLNSPVCCFCAVELGIVKPDIAQEVGSTVEHEKSSGSSSSPAPALVAQELGLFQTPTVKHEKSSGSSESPAPVPVQEPVEIVHKQTPTSPLPPGSVLLPQQFSTDLYFTPRFAILGRDGSYLVPWLDCRTRGKVTRVMLIESTESGW
jgi:hypothetical protein